MVDISNPLLWTLKYLGVNDQGFLLGFAIYGAMILVGFRWLFEPEPMEDIVRRIVPVE